MGMKLLDNYNGVNRLSFAAEDDFLWFETIGLWTSLAADSGASVAVSDAAKGILTLTTGATDNNEAAAKTTTEVFLMAANKPLAFETLVQYTEANTDDANVAVGFADSFGANLLVDNGAGPKTTFSGALIYKVDGGTVWKCISSKSTTQTITTTTYTAGGAAYQRLGIDIRPVSSTIAEVTFWIDPGDGTGYRQMKDNATPPQLIKHTVTYTSATEMQAGVYVKAGGSNSEVLNCDFIRALQER